MGSDPAAWLVLCLPMKFVDGICLAPWAAPRQVVSGSKPGGRFEEAATTIALWFQSFFVISCDYCTVINQYYSIYMSINK